MAYVPRKNESLIVESFYRPFVTGILGSRRVGKSKLTAHFITEHPELTWCLLNMDIEEQRLRISTDGLARVIEEETHVQLGKEVCLWVVIDEAQKLPALFEQIKVLYDQYKDQGKIKFIVTGSSILNLHALSTESLAGRIELFYLRAFTLQEQVKMNLNLPDSSVLDAIFSGASAEALAEQVALLAPFRIPLETMLEKELIWGGLPEVLKEERDDDKKRYLRDYIQTYLERDVRAVHAIGDLNLYRKLMEVLAGQTGSIRDDTKLSKCLAASRDTVRKYVSYLEATLMYQELPPLIENPMKRLSKSPKAYMNNNGLVSYLYGISDLALLEKTGLIGHRVENWVLKELQVASDRLIDRNQIYYWRTTAEQEVDFVIQKRPHIIPIEVTYSKEVDKKKIRAMQGFMKDYACEYGIILYRGPFIFDQEQRLCFIPLWALG